MARTELVLVIARFIPQDSARNAALTDDIAIAVRDHLRECLSRVPTIRSTELHSLVSRRDVAAYLGLSE